MEITEKNWFQFIDMGNRPVAQVPRPIEPRPRYRPRTRTNKDQWYEAVVKERFRNGSAVASLTKARATVFINRKLFPTLDHTRYGTKLLARVQINKESKADFYAIETKFDIPKQTLGAQK